ncbi:hypothetical protein PV327_009795 [Microctonus hyperodae]|uniref:SAM domain-containing protein n=1 Tax=Microctonus hyperodae TaxID=165561 RepID=A0AA39F1D0_MICHY|nr:hypothetical protein PV327_009795 [Microctonus hyperodae]
MIKMATSLSTYWVKFFTGAGFPLDVATKHAVVFSNNRIKPDMLPDLDKPSLKEMGITLMGDMIAILRYAKKVSDEMTCERFLVDNINDHSINNKASHQITKVPNKINQTKLGVKKVTTKLSSIANKSAIPTKSISGVKETTKSSLTSSNTSQIIAKKKPIVNNNNPRIVAQSTKLISGQAPQIRKRKVISQTEIIDSSESDDEEWTKQMQKRLKTTVNNDDDDNINETKNYKVLMAKPQQKQLMNQNSRSPQSTKITNKKILEQKRTVFDRLGDSSVTSTTNLIEPSTTFNITGLGNDVLKRNSSVFNRLGDRDIKNESTQSNTLLKNGNINNDHHPQGILKSKLSNIGSNMTVKLINSNAIGKFSGGTMHADHERNNRKKIVSNSVKQLVKNTKNMKLNSNNSSLGVRKNVRQIPMSRLASERVDVLSAKSRLGLTGTQKQVTFNKIATVKHIKKLGVFSRLGV